MTYDAADWLSQQLDLGTDSACKDDQRIVNTFWATGWEKQRDIHRAGAGCSSDPLTWPKKQTTTWTHFDNGKLRNLQTGTAPARSPSRTTSTTSTAGIYVNGNRTTRPLRADPGVNRLEVGQGDGRVGQPVEVHRRAAADQRLDRVGDVPHVDVHAGQHPAAGLTQNAMNSGALPSTRTDRRGTRPGRSRPAST